LYYSPIDMDYYLPIDEQMDITYADVLERIDKKCGYEKFILSNKWTAIRLNRWQRMATSKRLGLASIVHKAIETMARQRDPCIVITDGGLGKVDSATEVQLVALPSERGHDAIKKLSKEKLHEMLQTERNDNDRLKDVLKKSQKETEKFRQEAENWKAKAGELTLDEESFDDFPKCYTTMQFNEFLGDFSPQTGKRPNFDASEYLVRVQAALPYIITWSQGQHNRRNSKHPAEVLANAKNGVGPDKPSNCLAECTTTLCQVFKFIELTTGQQVVPSDQHLLSKITVEAFVNFYGQHAGSPSSAGNVAKILVSFYSATKGMTRYERHRPRIETIITSLNRFVQLKRQHQMVHKSKHLLDNQLLLKGEWLRSFELSRLNATVAEDIADFLRDNEDTVDFSKRQVLHFQRLLVLFCFLQTGGQRREFIGSFTIDNFASLESQVIYFTTSEKVQKRNTDRVQMPKTLGQLLRIFVEKFRPILVGENEQVISCWVNILGRPLRLRSVTRLVQSLISEKFPGRKVGPQNLRRMFVSAMQEVAAANKEDFSNWSADHATLINTSPKVLEENYNRFNNTQRSVHTLERVNQSLDLEVDGSIAELVDRHAEDVQYLDESQDMITKVLDKKYIGKELHYLCKMHNGEERWISYLVLDKFVDLVLAFLAAKHLGDTPSSEESADEEASEDVAQSEAESMQLSIEEEGCSQDDLSMPQLSSDSWSGSPSCDSVEIDELATEISGTLRHMQSAGKCLTQSKKRKRGASSFVQSKKAKQSPTWVDILKPGDVISINPPEDCGEEFWLAEVVALVKKSKVKIQWLERQHNSQQYKKLTHNDEVSLATVNGPCTGEWVSAKVYSIE
jgi:hypothetical protein